MQHDFILLDRSGSMDTKWADSLGAINHYVRQLAEQNVDTGVTLAVFDYNINSYHFTVVRDRITPKTWQDVTNADAVPRGWTPFNDANMDIVALANKGHNGTPYERVALLIITDGEENKSKEYTRAQATKALQECRDKGWQVTFIGVEYDNDAQAAGYGTPTMDTISVTSDSFAVAMADTAVMRSLFASSGAKMGYSERQKNLYKAEKHVDNKRFSQLSNNS